MSAPQWALDALSEFYDPEQALVWLNSPHRLLGGDAPIDRIHAGRPQS